MKCFLFWLEIVKEIANIAFFIGVPMVALLAFLQAKQTIFSGERNEVFKIKLEEILDTYKKISGIGVNSLAWKLNYFEIIEANLQRDKALRCLNELNLRNSTNQELKKNAISIIENKTKSLGNMGGYLKQNNDTVSYNVMALQNGVSYMWSNEFVFGNRHINYFNQIQSIMNSMLLPDTVKKNIEDMLDVIREVNTEICKDIRDENFFSHEKLTQKTEGEIIKLLTTEQGLLLAAGIMGKTKKIEKSAQVVTDSLKDYLKDKGLLLE